MQTALWYAPASYGALAVVVAIAVYGFRNSLGSQRILDTFGPDE